MPENQQIDIGLVKGLLKGAKSESIVEMLSSHHPADIARLMNALPHDEAKEIFCLLDPKEASEIIVELNDEARNFILDYLESNRVGEIVDHMASDDAADLLGALSEEDAKKVLENIPDEDTRHVKSLLAFEEDTAGGIMQTEVASISSGATVQQVINMLRKNRDEMEDIHNIFVIDNYQRLVGGLPVRRLVLESPYTAISDIMDTDYISAHVHEDQEEVAKLFKKYDLISLPVVDDTDRLIGRITIDDVVDVIEEEASEDFLKMAGAGSVHILPKSIMKSAKARLPWLFASCIGGLVALKIIGTFETTLGAVVALASFIPVILGMGGNIGTQSTTIVVRGLATGTVESGSLWKVVYKEIRIGLILGVVYGVFLSLATLIIYSSQPFLSIVVGLSMCASMVLASAVGTMMPIILYRSGVDPAIATGPFVTTSVDIIGILILLNFASIFLL